MSARTLLTERITVAIDESGVATMSWDLPPHNFVDDAFAVELNRHLAVLDHDSAVRAIVFAPAGRHFCAGWDHSPPTVSPRSETSARRPGPAAFDAVANFVALLSGTKPRVAAVQGAAIGGGLGLALAADARVTCAEARLSANFAALGLFPGSAMTVTLPHVVGPSVASVLLGTARRLTGTDAVDIGLCDRLAPRADVASGAHALAVELAALPPLAVSSIRATIRAGLISTLPELFAAETAHQQRLHDTDDFIEGVAAVNARRPPRFRGR